MIKVALLVISALALAQQATGAETCPAAVEALINALTADKLAGDKLKTECETIMNNDAYKEACKAVLNAKTQTLVTKDCPAAEPATTPESEPGDSGSTMTSLSAAVAMAVVLPLLRQ